MVNFSSHFTRVWILVHGEELTQWITALPPGHAVSPVEAAVILVSQASPTLRTTAIMQ